MGGRRHGQDADSRRARPADQPVSDVEVLQAGGNRNPLRLSGPGEIKGETRAGSSDLAT
jgi:hypothetical protein